MNAQEAQEAVANMTVRQLIRRCPKGVPMKEALDRQAQRKRKQQSAADASATYDEEEEAGARAALRAPGVGGGLAMAGAESGGLGGAGASRLGLDGDELAADEAVFAPQVRIIDGRIVIDEESLEVTAGRLDSRLEEPSLVIEGNSSVTYGTYMNKTPSDKWLPEETETFFRALGQYGTDFSLIEKILPSRSRRQIKLKFKREEREAPARVMEALRRRAPPDPDELHAIVLQVQTARAARPNAAAAAQLAQEQQEQAASTALTLAATSDLALAARRGAPGEPPPAGSAARGAGAEEDDERVIVEEDGDGAAVEPDVSEAVTEGEDEEEEPMAQEDEYEY